MDLSYLAKLKPEIPSISPGDTVKVSIKVREGERERIQPFQGIVIRVRKGGVSANFTVRRMVYGIGVERTIFFHSPLLEGVEVLQEGRARRARLYYLRRLSSKAIRAKLKPRAKTREKSKK